MLFINFDYMYSCPAEMFNISIILQWLHWHGLSFPLNWVHTEWDSSMWAESTWSETPHELINWKCLKFWHIGKFHKFVKIFIEISRWLSWHGVPLCTESINVEYRSTLNQLTGSLLCINSVRPEAEKWGSSTWTWDRNGEVHIHIRTKGHHS